MIGQLIVLLGSICVYFGLDTENTPVVFGLFFTCLGITVINW